MKHPLEGAILCRSGWSKFRGLMLSRRRTLVFAFDRDEHVPLHMLFVFFPIDVLYLDGEKRVVEVKRNFRPFTFYSPKNKARYVVEIPERTDIKVGDSISWGRRDLNPD
ncbi:DUF192 domain-containing protein [Candidatus Woesearchaeota archaeon]|nr:DUF192 domain-containing protein [Candidatus Woesearchaeota archaeon]